MKKIGIFYGSTTGNTEHLALDIAKQLNVYKQNIFEAYKLIVDLVSEYYILLI